MSFKHATVKKSMCRVLGNHSFQLSLFIIINLSHMTETFHFLKILFFFNSISFSSLSLSLFRCNDTYVFPNWRCESHYHVDAASHLILKEIVLFKKNHFLLKSSIPFISNKQRDLNFKISLIDQRRDESKHSIFMGFIYRMVELFIRTQFKVWPLQI